MVYDDVEGRKGGVGHYDGVDDYAGEIHTFGAGSKVNMMLDLVGRGFGLPLRPIAHGENELGTDKEDTCISEYGENV